MSSQSSTPETTKSARPQRKVEVRAIHGTLAACETILQNGGKPSREVHQAIVDYLRGRGPDPIWSAFPLTQSWFSQGR